MWWYTIRHLTVQVDCSSPSPFCSVLLNGSDISSNLTSVNDTYSYSDSSGGVEVIRETNITVSAVFSYGAALAVTYNSTAAVPGFQLTLDSTFDGMTRGLLGNNDDNSSNDLVTEQGQLLTSDPTDQEVHDFGNTCEILLELHIVHAQ